jgi:hypothetical protein
MSETKYIFVTGGVVSSIGKGTSAAALGMLLKSRGYRVVLQKFDPYINVDPGTMNPYQHGDGPGSRSLRAFSRREPRQALQRDHGKRLLGSHNPRAKGRLPGGDRAGNPAHNE